MPLTLQDIQAEKQRRALLYQIQGEKQRRMAAGRVQSPGVVAPTNPPPPSNYTGGPTGSLPTRMFRPVVEGVKGLVHLAGKWGEATDEDIQRNVTGPMIADEKRMGPNPMRGVSEAARTAIGGGQFFTTGLARFADQMVNPEYQGQTTGQAVKGLATGLVSSGKAILPQAGELYRHTVQNVTGTENPPGWLNAPANLADKAAGLMMSPEEIAAAKEGVREDPFAPFGTATVLAGGLKAGAGLVRGLKPRTAVPEKAPEIADTPSPEAVSKLGRGQGAEGPSKGLTPGVDVGEAPEPMIRTPKGTAATAELRDIQTAPIEGMKNEIRQMRTNSGRLVNESLLNNLDRSELEYVTSGGRSGKATRRLAALGLAGLTTYGVYKASQDEDNAAMAAGIGILGAGLMRGPTKDGGGRKLTAKEMRAGVRPEQTIGKINLERMNLSETEKVAAQVQVDRLRPSLEKMKGAKLTNEEVIDLAGEVKMSQEAISRSETAKRSAQILNARKNEAELLRKENVTPQELRKILETVRQVESVKTDLGREMQKLSINVDPELQTTRSALMTKLAKSDVDLASIEAKAVEYEKQGKSLDDPRNVLEFYRDFIKPKASEILDEYRYINMLSSPNTHIVNTTSNLIQGMILRPGTRLAAGGIDAIGSKLTGRERVYYTKQVPSYYKGMLNSLPAAIQGVRDVMSGKALTLRPDLEYLPTNSKWTKWGYPVTRALESSDIFVRTLVEGAEREALAYRAKRTGKAIDAEAIDAEAKQTAGNVVFRGELDPSNATGQGWVKSKVFDAPASMLNRLRQISPPFKWLVPFVQTPLNIAKQGFEYSPLGFVDFAVKDKTAQLAKASIGSTVFVGAGYIAMNNGSTWAIPTGKKAKEEFYAAGMKPYSLKIGDTWVSYSKLGPLAYPIALAAAMKYHFKDSPNALTDSNSDKITAGFAEMAQFFSDQSYVQSIGNILDAMQGATTGEWKGEVSQLIGGTGRQLIPLSALQGWVNGIIDPIYRKSDKDLTPEAILRNMQKNVIGLSTNLEPYTDRSGELSKKALPVGNAFSPIQVSPSDSVGEAQFEKSNNLRKSDTVIRKIREARKEKDDAELKRLDDIRRKAGIPPVAPTIPRPEVPIVPKPSGPIPQADIDSIPSHIQVKYQGIKSKSGEKVQMTGNARQVLRDLYAESELYTKILEALA